MCETFMVNAASSIKYNSSYLIVGINKEYMASPSEKTTLQ